MSDPINSVVDVKIRAAFKVRISFSRRDLSLLPLYCAMAGMQSEGERREYLRAILYRSIAPPVPAPHNTAARAMNMAKPESLIPKIEETSGVNEGLPPKAKVKKSSKERLEDSLKLMGASLDD